MIKAVQCAAVTILLCLSTAARALEYSGDGVYYGANGKTQTDKIYFSNGRVRVQTVGNKSYEIFDEVKHTGWSLIPANDKTKKDTLIFDSLAALGGIRYGVGPDFCARLLTATAKSTSKTTTATSNFAVTVIAPSNCKKLGPDMVNGHATEKWQFSRSVLGQNAVWTNWVDRSLDAVVKVQKGSEMTYQLLNVHVGPQPASLFATLPPDAVLNKLMNHK